MHSIDWLGQKDGDAQNVETILSTSKAIDTRGRNQEAKL